MPASSRRRSTRRSVCARREADAMGAKHFGARVTRLEDPALLSGRGRFVDDVKMSSVLHACFVRSPYAHARLLGIDAKAVLAMPGVHAVIAAEDLPDPMRSEAMPMLLPNPSISALCTQHVLARAEVYYVGQPVAVVIADTRYIAEDAAAAVAVHYDAMRSRTARRGRMPRSAPMCCRRSSSLTATSMPPSPTPRISSRMSSGSTAAAAWRSRRARCSPATMPRPTC